MVSYFALNGADSYGGGYLGCVYWAREQVLQGAGTIKVVRARIGEPDAFVIAEVSNDGVRMLRSSRSVSLARLRGRG